MKNIYVVCEVLNYYGDYEETNCIKAFTIKKEANNFMNSYIEAQRNNEDKNGNVKFCHCFIDKIPLIEGK